MIQQQSVLSFLACVFERSGLYSWQRHGLGCYLTENTYCDTWQCLCLSAFQIMPVSMYSKSIRNATRSGEAAV